MDEMDKQRSQQTGIKVESGIRLAKIERAPSWYSKLDKTVVVSLLILILLPIFALTKCEYDTREHTRSLDIIYNAMKRSEASGGYIKVNGKEDSPLTKFMMDLLKIYGFHPYLESNPDLVEPKLSLSSDTTIDLATLKKALSVVPITNFHEGYNNAILLYGYDGDNSTSKAKSMLDAKSIVYQFVNLSGDDPAKDGMAARLFVSGFDPESVNKDTMLEYKGKLYPDPDLFAVIEKMTQ